MNRTNGCRGVGGHISAFDFLLRGASVDDEEMFAAMQWQPFGTKDAADKTAQLGRCMVLAEALWARSMADLERQLQLPTPKLPSGFALADFKELLRLCATMASVDWSAPRFKSWRLAPAFSQQFFVGSQRLTAWEARREVVLPAIEHLENP